VIEYLFSAICSAYELGDEQRELLEKMVELTYGEQAGSPQSDVEFDELIADQPEGSPVLNAFSIYVAETAARL
jgi:hypothetical protein